MRIYLDVTSRLPAGSIGTRAFIISSMEIIRRHIPDVEFLMLSCYPEMDAAYYGREGQHIRIIKRSISQLGTVRDIRNILRKVDAVVSVWGDGYIISPPHKIFYKAAILKKRNIPLVLFPSSLGPFGGVLKSLLAKKGLEKFDRLMVRDTITYDYCKKIGLSETILLPDAAFILPTASDAAVLSIFSKEGIPSGAKFIGLNVSQLLTCLSSDKDIRNYSKTMADLAEYLVHAYDRNILLIPHQVYTNNYEPVDKRLLLSLDGDDRIAIQAVLKFIKHNSRIHPILGEYTPQEYKGIIGKCDIFIGGRMHSVIGAISMGVPSLIMQYSHKAAGVMNMLDLMEYIWCFDSAEDDLREKIQKLWINKEFLRDSFIKRMPRIKEDTWRAGEILRDVVVSSTA